LFVYAINQLSSWTKREWVRWTLLGAIVLFLTVSQLQVNAPAFSSGTISFTASRFSCAAVAYSRLRFRVGKFLRLVLATLRNSFRLIDLYMLLDAPRSDDFDRLPRLAASAAPAAICCFFDLAGITKMFRSPTAKRIC